MLKVPSFVLEVYYNRFTCIRGQKTLSFSKHFHFLIYTHCTSPHLIKESENG